MFAYYHDMLRFGEIYRKNGIKQVILGIPFWKVQFS